MHHIQNQFLVVGHPDNFVECFGEKRQTTTFKLTPEDIAAGEVSVTVANRAHITSTISGGTPALEIAAEGILEADLSRPYQTIYCPGNRLAFDVIGHIDVVDACVGQWDTMAFSAVNHAMRDYVDDMREEQA